MWLWYLNSRVTACLSHWKSKKQRHAYWNQETSHSSGLYEWSNGWEDWQTWCRHRSERASARPSIDETKERPSKRSHASDTSLQARIPQIEAKTQIVAHQARRRHDKLGKGDTATDRQTTTEPEAAVGEPTTGVTAEATATTVAEAAEAADTTDEAAEAAKEAASSGNDTEPAAAEAATTTETEVAAAAAAAEAAEAAGTDETTNGMIGQQSIYQGHHARNLLWRARTSKRCGDYFSPWQGLSQITLLPPKYWKKWTATCTPKSSSNSFCQRRRR
jgi:hypothetical protein